ncbi:hypothetical protein [Sphingobacterium sp. UBA6645]|uniref:hypothetical protein n=1 Tax=Sphingobacterium sp. UBA6645 TaxID=1947511 RepID=UPI0025D6C62D|nr:hypothetical protein [Sphingobacterium sp. UBA6645]
MKILIAILFSSIIFLTSCDKQQDDPNAPECYKQMKQRYDKQLGCSKKGEMEVNLYRGLYQGKEIYFPMTMCPSCNTVAPAEGYTCEGEKIAIEDFNRQVTAIKEVYNSCTRKFAY